MTTLIILNEETDDIMKTIRSLKQCGLLINGANGTIKNEAKKQRGGFFSMLLGTLGTSLLTGNSTIRAGEGTIATVLHRFEIPAPVCNFYPDLKSLCLDLKTLPQFIIFLPRFETPKASPIL